ncbi:MAG TPA: MarR family transcriptional regulator [Candidatus Paceibacterota bacterium]|nr:MarR family transcriptional regulator [Candidatus Paceibacterota bacterium]
MKNETYAELTSLFFAIRQIIRSKLPTGENSDPNVWLRCETINYIVQEGEPTMQDLAAYLCIRPSSATSLINTLSRAQLVRRVMQADDRRIVRISLTPKGKRVLRGYVKEKTATMHKVFSKLDEAEVHQLVIILRRLREIHQNKSAT